MLITLGITLEGKIFLGIYQAANENELDTHLSIQQFLKRDLRYKAGPLSYSTPRKDSMGSDQSLAGYVVIQRCQWHNQAS